MSPRLDPVLRFPFDAADQARFSTAPADIVADDFPLRDATNVIYALAFDLRFRVQDPQAGAPRIRLAGPGKLTFLADPADPRPVPAPNAVAFTSAAHATWPTRGILVLDLLPPAPAEIQLVAQDLELVPTRLWYGPVELPLDFLQTALARRKQKLPAGGGAPTVLATNPDWLKHAVSRFLAGRFQVEMRLGMGQADDDAAQAEVPRAVMGTDPADAATYGRVRLTVTAGRRVPPFDAPARLLATAPGGASNSALPEHPASGCLPARHFFRAVRPGLIGADLGEPIPDAVLDANANRYAVLRVTRTWTAEPECSAYFPQHLIRLADPAGGGVIWEQRLPTHGAVLLPYDPALPLGELDVSLVNGPMRWLSGTPAPGAPAVWLRQGGTAAVRLDLAPGFAHLVARLPMQSAVMIEERHQAKKFAACTYYSLRRTLRAFADNRICGGRLNHNEKRNSGSARALLAAAWNGKATFVPTTAQERVRDPATRQQVNLRDHPALFLLNGAPSPKITQDEQIGARNRLLSFVFRLFFPDPAPQHAVPGAAAVPTILTQGEVCYALWQTSLGTIHRSSTRANFDPAHIARGAPGAMAAVGLAAYVGNHRRNVAAGETVDAYANRVVLELLALSLQEGALLQFWSKASDFEAISTPGMAPNTDDDGVPAWTLPGSLNPNADEADNSYGHSPVFASYGPMTTKPLRVIDQYGTSDVDLKGTNGSYKLEWNGIPERVWIAANWTE